MKILIDMNLTARWVEFLEDEGWRTQHWASIGRAYDADPLIMSYARQHGFVILTNDLDFGELLRTSGETEPTVIQVRGAALGPEYLGVAVVEALRKIEAFFAQGYLVTIDQNKSRMRVLPFALED